MTRTTLLILTLLVAAVAQPALASKFGIGKKTPEQKVEKAEKQATEAAERKASTDAMETALVAEVTGSGAAAKALHEKAFGHAAFDNTKVAVIVSGGGGHGVAVAHAGGARTYMKMGTAGVGLGLGAQKYQVLFLFETEAAFRAFVDKGWQGGAGATAAAGTEGANAAATFHDGVAVFTLTDKGLMANADVSGTKYWKDDKINE